MTGKGPERFTQPGSTQPGSTQPGQVGHRPVPLVAAEDPMCLDRAAAVLAAGGVIAVPTDTVYGLVVDPWSSEAVKRVFALKGRPVDVALPVLVGGMDQLPLVAAALPAPARKLVAAYWPGPLTVVVRRSAGFRADLGGDASLRATVAVRWPDHPLVEALCRAMGPLAATSANRHGAPPMTDAAQIIAGLSPTSEDGPGVDLVVDGQSGGGAASTVVECLGPAIRCLREGPLLWADIAGAARSHVPDSNENRSPGQ